MADGDSEQTSGNQKTEVKEDELKEEAPHSEEDNKGGKTDEESVDNASEEESKVKTESSNKKDEKKAKTEKNVKKKEEKKDESEEEDEDESEGEELPPGLLERPLEVEGKREKKKVERLSATMIRSPPEKKVEIEEGSGTKLGDIPYVEHQLNITKAADLKPLHRVLFVRVGTANEVKRNIRLFNGFTYGADSKEYEKKVALLNKMVTAELKSICTVLGLERSGTKQNLVDRVMEFLLEPEDKGLKVKSKGKKRSSSKGGKSKNTKKKKTKKPVKKGKVNKSDDSSEKDSSDEEEEEEEAEEEVEDEEEDEEEKDEDSDYEVSKKKKTKTESKKKAPKKSAKENGKKEKPTSKEKKKPVSKKRAAVSDSDSLSDEEDSEDEPISKMKKLSPPSDDEIKDLVKELLDGADLEKVTMKTVVKQVYAKYPSFDLSDRKDLIKDTVREVIS